MSQGLPSSWGAKSFLTSWFSKLGNKRRSFYEPMFHGDVTDPVTIEVPLGQIRLRIKNRWNKFHEKGRVRDGDWDLKEVHPIETLDTLIAFRQHFKQGLPWSQTEFYRFTLREIESGRVKWGCRTKEELDRRFTALDTLYDEIRHNGYQPQAELPGKEGTSFETHDEVTVCINRHGDLMFSDGRHRLSIAILLGLKSIPVQVTYRHKAWQDFRDEVWAYARSMKGKVYAPLLHPDLAHIPSYHSHDRFRLIRESLPINQGDLLDIGAHWGYFCHMFEAAGFECYAAESSSRHLYFLETLRRAENRNFKVLSQSVLEPLEKTTYDVVLALNIFHHFLKTSELFHKMVGLLRSLDTKIMYLGTHKPEEGQMQEAFKNYTPEEFVEFVVSESCLTASRQLGTLEDGRALYMLTR